MCFQWGMKKDQERFGIYITTPGATGCTLLRTWYSYVFRCLLFLFSIVIDLYRYLSASIDHHWLLDRLDVKPSTRGLEEAHYSKVTLTIIWQASSLWQLDWSITPFRTPSVCHMPHSTHASPRPFWCKVSAYSAYSMLLGARTCFCLMDQFVLFHLNTSCDSIPSRAKRALLIVLKTA